MVARVATTTAADGSWSVSLSPHAVGDDRDEVDVDYSGAGAPQPNHQVILTGNGGNPFIEAGWTGWFDLDNGTALTSSSLSLAPCVQSGVLAFSFNGIEGQSPTDFCNLQTDTATIGTATVGPSDRLTVTSNDNRAFINGQSPNPLGGLVSLTVPVGEPSSVSPFTSPLSANFTPSGLPSCAADLEFQAVLCEGLVPNGDYLLSDGRQQASVSADATGTVVSPLRVRGGDSIALSNGSRTLTTLHVAHLQVAILGEQDAVASGRCQPGDYFGAPLSSFPTTTGAAGVATNDVNGGVALTGQICPTNGDASGLPAATIAQTDDLSGGQTETEVPDVQDTSPIEGETMYGKFTALAESGLSAPGNMSVPTDVSTRITLRIVTVHGRAVFVAKNVDTEKGVSVPALKPGPYIALWLLTDANGDQRLVGTRFVEQPGRVERAPRAKVSCHYTNSHRDRISCSVRFMARGKIKGTVRVRLMRGNAIVGLGHGPVRAGRATVSLKVLRPATGGTWRLTLVLARPHLVAATETVRLPAVG